LRNNSHSFTVEVKRHRGRPSTAETTPIFARSLAEAARDLAREDDKNAAATFAAASQGHAPPAVAPTIGTGRILPSLVESDPLISSVAESNLLGRRGGRGDEPGEQGGSARKVSGRRRRIPRDHDLSASAMAGTSSALDSPQEARSSDEPTIMASVLVDGPAKAPARGATRKSKRHVKNAENRAILPTIPMLVGAETVATPDAPEATRSPAEDAAARKRRRSVLARYVFGTEPKLGERWKRRLRRPR
jgi:hypothetical protein